MASQYHLYQHETRSFFTTVSFQSQLCCFKSIWYRCIKFDRKKVETPSFGIKYNSFRSFLMQESWYYFFLRLFWSSLIQLCSPFLLPLLFLWFFLSAIFLQLPIREACHVAVQRNHPSKHRLWKHALARQQAKGQGPTPVLEIVCIGIWIEMKFSFLILSSKEGGWLFFSRMTKKDF